MNNYKKKPVAPRYPNAASPQYYIDKFLDGLLAVVTGIGTFVTLLFLFLL